MPRLLDRISGRERLRMVCALAFWISTYLLFLTWNQLQDDYPTAIWHVRRLLTTLAGAVIFFGYTRLADRVSDRPLKARVRTLALGAVASVALIIVARIIVSEVDSRILGEPHVVMARHLRFAMIWAGYFAGGALAFIAFAPSLQTAIVADPPATPANDETFTEAFWVSRGRETMRVSVDTIDWIEAEGDYVRLHARGGGGLMRGTLTNLEATLDPQIFARVHRSAICRRDAIAVMMRKPTGAMAVRLENGDEVPVGRRYRDSVSVLLTSSRDGLRRLPA